MTKDKTDVMISPDDLDPLKQPLCTSEKYQVGNKQLKRILI